jgi:hypothetical protein
MQTMLPTVSFCIMSSPPWMTPARRVDRQVALCMPCRKRLRGLYRESSGNPSCVSMYITGARKS